MSHETTIYELHGRLLRDTFGRDLNDRDAFLLFTLFHHYQIELTGPVLTDRPSTKAGDRVHADSQRGCAEALASLWAGCDDERADYTYWCWRWNGEWGSYGHAENLTAEEAAELRRLIVKLEHHPFVSRFVPENEDLLGGNQPA